MNAPVESKLLSCPFCGGEAAPMRSMGDRLYGRTEPPYYGEQKHRVKCTETKCCAITWPFDTLSEATTAWNTRPQVAELVEALEDEKRFHDHLFDWFNDRDPDVMAEYLGGAYRALIASHKGEQP